MYRNDYVVESRQLRAKGRQLAQLFQLYKALGLANIGLGSLGLIASPVSAIPVSVGVVAYLMALATENKRIGRLNPIPWVKEDLETIAQKSLTEGGDGGVRLETQAHHYLDDEDKALYYLCNFQGHRLTELAESLDDESFEHIVINLVDHLVAAHTRQLNYPEILSRKLGEGKFFKEAISNLPPELGHAVPVTPAPDRRRFEEGESLAKPALQPSSEPCLSSPGLIPRLSAVTVSASPVDAAEEANGKEGVQVLDVLFSDGRINPEFLARPMADRAQFILDVLKAAGCDISQFVGDQIMGATGTQRSGKTTLLMILTILEKALTGKKITYITVDDDVYPVAFDKVISGIDAGTDGYWSFLRQLPGLKKNQASDRIWFLDECTKAMNLCGKSAHELLWNGLTTGFLKSKGAVRLVMHGETAAIMGIPDGYVAQVKDESTFIKALRKRDDGTNQFEGAGKYPSGKYLALDAQGVSFTPSGEAFQLPSWLLSDENEDATPCYVRSLLRFFPELDTRCTGRSGGSMSKEVGRTSRMLDNTHSRAEFEVISDAFNDLFREDDSDNPELKTDWIDNNIETLKKRKNNRSECMAELLEFIRQEALEGKTELRRGELTTGSWASKWKKRGSEFRDCSGQEFNRFVDTAIKAGFLSTEDHKTYLIRVS